MMRGGSRRRNVVGDYESRLYRRYVILHSGSDGTAMLRIHPSELQRMTDGLQQAIRDHAEWHRRIIRTLVCRLTVDPSDLRHDAFCSCGFGRWLHDPAQQTLKERPQYASVDSGHRRLHELAGEVLSELTERASISAATFDRFVEQSVLLRVDLDSLRNDMLVALRSRDVVTGTYRRLEVLPALREARELCVRGVQASCIAFMDLDRFKAVNDTFGHGLGDEVLAQAARCIIEHLRAYDRVFRYGGDEFLLLLPGTHPEEAWRLVDRIRQRLAETALGLSPAGGSIRLTASFGITSLEPDLTVEESIARADKALLLAKAAGRNRVVCWDPAVTTGTMIDREISARPTSPGLAAR
jgi:diguanylate cyclase (GGDEF)-like protein